MKDDIAIRKAALLKTARMAVRLRHSLEADAELAVVLPRIENLFTQAVQRGELPEVAALLQDVIDNNH